MNTELKLTRQYLLTTAAGKRLIAKAYLSSEAIIEALKDKTIVILGGTTNGYVAEEILTKIGQINDFSKDRFYRGITLPPKYIPKKNTEKNTEKDSSFLGDVVIEKGVWQQGKTIFDVADDLKEGDIIIKGANAVNLESKQAAILIGHPRGGTITTILQAVVGRRVRLFIPVGLEKRISGDINKIAQKLNSLEASGSRYMPVMGEIMTELDAINLLTGAEAELIAGGGVCGAEGSYWLAVTGSKPQLEIMTTLIKELHLEPNFQL